MKLPKQITEISGLAVCLFALSAGASAQYVLPTDSPRSFALSMVAIPSSAMETGTYTNFQSASQTQSGSIQQKDQNTPGAPDEQNPLGGSYRQTKRILGIIPNFRSVSVDEKLPPLSTKKKFWLAIQDSTDYSAFIYVGILSGVNLAEGSYPEFHHGAPAYGRYYWHNFADNLLTNTFTEAIVPSLTHEDPRYYTLGRGGILKRTTYAFSRSLITRADSGGSTFNFSEIIGNGAGSGISNLYYPSRDRTWTKTGQKWLFNVAFDSVTNVVKEFWPDINHSLFRNKY